MQRSRAETAESSTTQAERAAHAPRRSSLRFCGLSIDRRTVLRAGDLRATSAGQEEGLSRPAGLDTPAGTWLAPREESASNIIAR